MTKAKRKGTLLKGQIVDGTYEILFFIGEGAFGEVYRVRHKYLGTQVLKLFKADFEQSANLEEITREAKILAQITHPNVVRVFEANSFEIDGAKRHYITMGFVSGETLTQLMARKITLSPAEATPIMLNVLEGLKAAHELTPPIIHRDINPDNILLSYEHEKPAALLSDFGLAQPINMGGHLPGAAGRYPYMAPECFWGGYLLASDVFSAGVTLYRMLAGVHPWQYDFDKTDGEPESIVTEIMRARKTECRPPSFHNEEGGDKRLDVIVLKAIEKDLEARYKNAAEFLEDLRTWAELRRPRSAASGVHKAKTLSAKRDGVFTSRRRGKGLDLVAGMHEFKETLYQDIIRPLSEPELYREYGVTPPNGVLLYGPPGCGKTFIAQKLAEEIGYHYIEVKPSDLASIYVHGTQEKIGQMFKEAEKNAPTLIFIDEVDAVLPSREGKLSQHYAAEVNEFLAQMTECSQRGIFIVAATNRPEKIDAAILRTGRMDKVVYLAPPDLEAREEMLRLYLESRPVEEGFDYRAIAEETDCYVSSDIKFLVNESSRSALKERSKISAKHFEQAMQKHQPSISKEQILAYERYRDKRTFSEP